jgi:hypothetical protein
MIRGIQILGGEGGTAVKKLLPVLLGLLALTVAAPAAADRPTEFPILEVFPDTNPCTNTPMIVTFTGTGSIHEHGSRVVVIAHRTITTSDGFVGHGTDSFVDNGQVVMSRITDVMTNASGDRFRARGVFVLDISTDTVRVDRFSLTCLGPA